MGRGCLAGPAGDKLNTLIVSLHTVENSGPGGWDQVGVRSGQLAGEVCYVHTRLDTEDHDYVGEI